ncbi:MAG TPA: amidohydrolase family protein [Candidatus Sulfotelmatobacter sp.]|jgi:hypothetical protein|nr:amidohydrolase family protein [Candidatus Sulfotelmatobacter sp.]
MTPAARSHRTRLLAAAMAVAAAWVVAPAARPRIYAITGGTVITAPGQRIEGATVVLRDGLVEAVGAKVAVPADAVAIDAKGSFVYPGFIDAGGWSPEADTGSAGAPASSPGERRRATPREPDAGPVYAVALVHPERRAADTLTAFSGDRKRDAASMRKLGIVAVLAVPAKGVLRGSSALALLEDDTPVADVIVRDDVAQHAAFETVPWGEGYPTSVMGAAAALRQVFLDAQRYGTWTARYAKHPEGMARPADSPALASLQEVLAGRQPLFLESRAADDALLADRIAREFGIDLVVIASGEEADVLEPLAKSGRTLILPAAVPDKPKVDDPDEALEVPLRVMRRYLDASTLPVSLKKAGIPFALSAHGLKNPPDFSVNLRKMVEAGLSEDEVLAALTTVPAKLLGVGRSMGTLERGKIANLLIADGPIFAKETRIRRVFVDGLDYPVEEKPKPKGDPNAVVDPRGTWSVAMQLPGQTVQRTWTIRGEAGHYTGTAETRSGTVTFDAVTLAGNALTVTFPASEGRPATEVTVIVTGDSFEGTFEMGARSAPISGTRTHGPDGSAP